MFRKFDNIKINFFGTGCIVIKGEYDDDIWNLFSDASREIKSSFDHAIFDYSFYESLNSKKFRTWTDLGNVFSASGLLSEKHSHIEIRINNRQRRKIFFADLLGDYLLFPAYQTTMKTINLSNNSSQKSLVAVEKEIGTIASYKFDCKDFSLDRMRFNLQKVIISEKETFIILSGIYYSGNELAKFHTDALVKERYAFVERSNEMV